MTDIYINGDDGRSWDFGGVLRIHSAKQVALAEGQTHLLIEASCTTHNTSCHCGKKESRLRLNGCTHKTMADEPLNNKPVHYRVRLQRYYCLMCKKTFQQSLQPIMVDAYSGGKITIRLSIWLLKLMLNHDVTRTSIYQQTAQMTGYSRIWARKWVQSRVRESKVIEATQDRKRRPQTSA